MASNGILRQSVRPDRNIAPAKSVRPKPHSARSRSTSRFSIDDSDSDSGRVRVAIRLRPKNAEDLACDPDFIDCVELQPELKRLKLRKNNWTSDSYRFDEVFTESASQKRVYDAVAKPVVESVLHGYNGTVMAYGQTGTGKTYTVGRLGKEDPSERGIMVRSMEDILADASPGLDTVLVTYLQLYLESIQDLLAPEKINIPIVEDPKTGEVSLPGTTMVEIRDLDQFLEVLQIGEANRHAANTKLNTESSRSHAILMVHVQRSSKVKEENDVSSLAISSDFPSRNVPVLLKSKLLIVDLAGSERVDKSGSEGHMLEEAKFINLSLTSLGKCINALAENSPHIPTRDSKLTRLLRDSFGGTARTSLIVTVGPSGRHYSETSSTIMFGQRAMKIMNILKLKEEFDYKSHCRKLEYQVDHLTSEMERQQKVRDTEKVQIEKRLRECEVSLAESEKFCSVKSEGLESKNTHLELKIKSLLEELNLQKEQNSEMSDEIIRLEVILQQIKQHQLENSTYQNVLADTTQMYEKKVLELTKQVETEQFHSAKLEGEIAEIRQHLGDSKRSVQLQQRVVDELNLRVQEMSKLNEDFLCKIQALDRVNKEILSEKELLNEDIRISEQKLLGEETQRKCLEDEIAKLKKQLSNYCAEVEFKKSSKEENLVRTSGLGGSTKMTKPSKLRETISGQRDTITKIFEEVGLSNVVSMLRSDDLHVQIHAAKVIANLAADDSNQERIVEEGGLDALLMLLESTEDSIALRVAAGAVANLAMNGLNQGLIVSKGGVCLLANIATQTDDPQTLRMVAGAIANLCGNESLHAMLKEDGGIKSLLEMAKKGSSDIIAQVARGIANFAKCESRGRKTGKSFLIEDGALNWIIADSTTYSSSTRRHIELALCHLAQNDYNALDIISNGGIKELVRISQESSKEDMRNLAKKALNSNPAYLAKIDRS